MSSEQVFQARVAAERRAAERRAIQARAELAAAKVEYESLVREMEALARNGLEADRVAPIDQSIFAMEDAAAARAIRAHIKSERNRIVSTATRLKLDLRLRMDDRELTAESVLADVDMDALRKEQGPDRTSGGEPAEVRDRSAEVEALIEKRLGALRADALPTARMESLLETARNPQSEFGRRRMAAQSLAAEVAEANKSALDKEEVDDLLSRITGLLAGNNSVAARNVRAAMEDPDLGPDGARLLVGEAEEIEKVERKAWEDGYIGDALADVLEELNYKVEEDFETELADDGFTDVRSDRWPGYVIRVRRTYTGRLSFMVIRGQDWRPDHAARDREVEREWCDAAPKVFDGMKKLGVSLDLERLIEPGSVATQVDVDIETPADEDEVGSDVAMEE